MMKEYFKPTSIGRLRLKNNLVAAPMAGLSSIPYRVLAMECGAALSMSEMVSVEGAVRGCEGTTHYFANEERARPFGVQLFGVRPEAFTETIASLEERPVDLIDINMGCPVKKVTCRGAGSALMKDLKSAEAIITAARRATKRPVTVKIRAGWDEASVNCAPFAKMIEGAGADAVAVHARTKTQEFRGTSDWSHIRNVKKAVKIPVIGNGDVRSRVDAIRMIDETGCDLVMIGRAAMGNPWIFREIVDENFQGPTREERMDFALRHLAMLKEQSDPRYAAMDMKAILPSYVKGISGVKLFLREVMRLSDYDKMREQIAIFFKSL